MPETDVYIRLACRQLGISEDDTRFMYFLYGLSGIPFGQKQASAKLYDSLEKAREMFTKNSDALTPFVSMLAPFSNAADAELLKEKCLDTKYYSRMFALFVEEVLPRAQELAS